MKVPFIYFLKLGRLGRLWVKLLFYTYGCQSAHLSVMGAISPHGDSYYRLQESRYTGSAVAQFSRDLLGLTSPKLHLIWDGASLHRRQEVKDWLRTDDQESRVQLTLRPAYSPQLNAAFQVWAWLQGGELKQVCGNTLDELTQQVQPAFSKLTGQRELIRNFFTHPEVAFY